MRRLLTLVVVLGLSAVVAEEKVQEKKKESQVVEIKIEAKVVDPAMTAEEAAIFHKNELFLTVGPRDQSDEVSRKFNSTSRLFVDRWATGAKEWNTAEFEARFKIVEKFKKDYPRSSESTVSDMIRKIFAYIGAAATTPELIKRFEALDRLLTLANQSAKYTAGEALTEVLAQEKYKTMEEKQQRKVVDALLIGLKDSKLKTSLKAFVEATRK